MNDSRTQYAESMGYIPVYEHGTRESVKIAWRKDGVSYCYGDLPMLPKESQSTEGN